MCFGERAHIRSQTWIQFVAIASLHRGLWKHTSHSLPPSQSPVSREGGLEWSQQFCRRIHRKKVQTSAGRGDRKPSPSSLSSSSFLKQTNKNIIVCAEESVFNDRVRIHDDDIAIGDS